jgi:hypothetical protein
LRQDFSVAQTIYEGEKTPAQKQKQTQRKEGYLLALFLSFIRGPILHLAQLTFSLAHVSLLV